MDGVPDLHHEGVTARGAPVLDENGFLRKYPLRLGRAKTLAELVDEYAFFTPAVLYLHGGFRDSPLADLCLVTGIDVRFYYHKFSRPVFTGLEAPSNGNPDWNFVLWAVQRDHWRLTADWLVSLTLSYAESCEAAGIGEQELVVADPLAAERVVVHRGDRPLVDVGAFGLNGSRFRAYLKPAPDLSPPRLTFDRPDETMRTFADALYGGFNPVNARATHRRVKLKDEERAP